MSGRWLRGRLDDDERGLVLVFVLVLMTVLLGMLALVVDVGNARQQRRQAQTAADAAALAAVEVIEVYGPGFEGVPGQWADVVQQVKGYARLNFGVATSEWVGCSDANALEYTPDSGVGNTCISADFSMWPGLPVEQDTEPVVDPPQYANHVRVRLPQRSISTFFGSLLGADTLSTGASATAAVTRTVEWVMSSDTVTTPGGPCALCILSDTGLALDGQNGDVTITGGGVTANSVGSSTGDAASLNPNGHVKLTLPCDADTGECNTIGGPGAPSKWSGAGYSPAPEYKEPVGDPLANVPQCGNGGLGDGTTTTAPSVCPTNVISTAANKLSSALSPGIYLHGIEGSHTLSAGVYVLKDDIVLNGNDVLEGDGVTLYLACASYPAPCSTAGEVGAGIKATGNGALRLTAPISGDYAGLVLFADRNNTATQTYRGNGSNESGPQSGTSGTMYLKTGTLDLRGNGYTLASMIVTGKFSMNGNPSAVTIAYDLDRNFETTTTSTTYTWRPTSSFDANGLSG